MVKLEIFDTPEAAERMVYLDPDSVETLRHAAYDLGYSAGWQDGTQAARTQDSACRTAIAEALQAVTFTYAEARVMAEAQLAEIVAAIIQHLVPPLCAAALPGRVVQELHLMLARDGSAPLQLLCAPGTQSILEEILVHLPKDSSVVLVEEPTLAPAQVLLRGQDQLREIDLSGIIGIAQEAMAFNLKDQKFERKGAEHG
jgi:flagellar biosynthesis/type III secretory pathway protein FliH